MVVALTTHQSNLSSDIRAGLGKGWKMWGNPYPRAWVWWLVPFFRVDTVVHLCKVLKAWSPSGRTLLVVPTFYTHGSVMTQMCWGVYICWSLILLSWTFNANASSNEFIACHLRNPYAFMQMYKCLLIPLHPPDIYVLELSLAST